MKSFTIRCLVAKIDKIKEQIGYLKVIFGLLFATDLSLIGYLFNKYSSLSLLKMVLVLVGIVIVTVTIYFVNREILVKIDEMEEL